MDKFLSIVVLIMTGLLFYSYTLEDETYSQAQYDLARVKAYKKGMEDGMGYVSGYWAGELQNCYIREGGKS